MLLLEAWVTSPPTTAHHNTDVGLQDAIAVWAQLHGEEQPPVVLVGHSMGGAVAVRCAATKVNICCLRYALIMPYMPLSKSTPNM